MGAARSMDGGGAQAGRPLQWKRVAFTGRLATMSRAEAAEAVERAGGVSCSGVTRATSILVVGMGGWPVLRDGHVGSALTRAEDLKRRGAAIQIVSEARFLEMIGLRAPPPADEKTHSSQSVCELLGIGPEVLHRWELLSLVRSDDGRFDYRDLVSLRTIAELVQRGVNPSTIARSLHRLSGILPDIERPLCQLRIVMENERSLVADLGSARLAADGQLLFSYDALGASDGEMPTLTVSAGAEGTAAEWFEHGCEREEEGRIEEAVAAYRRAIELQPHFAEAHFNLGNVLRSEGDLEASEAMLMTALRQDGAMACAWYNLADLFDEQGRDDEAVGAYAAALEVCPTYEDAHFNIALCLERKGRTGDARAHWAAYLKLDGTSEWADAARMRLYGAGAFEEKRKR